MFAIRFAIVLVFSLLAITFAARESVGQTLPKGKAKSGFPLVIDANDLPKPGTVLGSMALVQRPGPLKGARAWSIETKAHRYGLLSFAASPDGKLVATGGYDGLIRLWDAETGTLVRALAGSEGFVYGLAWSPDGHYLASAGSYSTKVWDPTTGLAVRTLKSVKLGATIVAWLPNGTRVVTAGGGSGQVAVFDVASAKQLEALEFGNAIISIAVHPSGEKLAIALSGSAQVVDSARLKTIYTLTNAAEGNYSAAFSPDGKTLALGSVKATRLYNAESGDLLSKIDGPGYAHLWSPNGSLIIVTTGNQVVVHAAITFSPDKPLPGAASYFALSADGSTLFGLYSTSVTRWNLGKAVSLNTFPVLETATLTTGPSTSVLVTHDADPVPIVWDQAGKRIGPLEGHVAGLSAWSPNGKIVAVAGSDAKIRTWDPATAKPLRTLTCPKPATALAVSLDGKIAAGQSDGKIVIWSAAGETILQTLAGPAPGPTAVAWSADGRWLAAGGEKQLITWSIEKDKGKRLKTIDPVRPIYGVVWSSDATKLMVASSGEVALVVYAVATGKAITFIEKGEVNLATSTLSWSPDGSTLLGFKGGGAQQWHLRSGHMTAVSGSPAPLQSINYLPDGRTITAACVDRSVRYFDAATGRFRFSMVANGANMIAVSAEGHYRTPEIAEADLIAIIHTDKSQDTMSLKEFVARFGFKNQPGLVK